MKAKNNEIFVKIASKQATPGIFNNLKSLNSDIVEKEEKEKNKLINYKIKSIEPYLTINTNKNLINSINIYQEDLQEKLAYYSDLNTDIILKGHLINLGINSKGLIGSNINSFSQYIGCRNNEKSYDYFSHRSNNFIKITYQHQQNGITDIYCSNTESEDKKLFTISSHKDKSVYDILSTEIIAQSKDLEQNITYSYRKYDNKISVSVALTNISEQSIKNMKYNYMINLKLNNIFVHYNKPAFINYDKNFEGLYLKTKNTRAYIVMDLNNITTKYNPEKNPDIVGLAFEKAELKPNETYLINFCFGFTTLDKFNSDNFVSEQTGLKLSYLDFKSRNLSSIITTCADFTDCDISNADLSNNILIGAKTGPLLSCCNLPANLPYGYEFIITQTNEKFIIGPGIDIIF